MRGMAQRLGVVPHRRTAAACFSVLIVALQSGVISCHKNRQTVREAVGPGQSASSAPGRTLLIEQVPLDAMPGNSAASPLELAPPADGSRIIRVDWVGGGPVETVLTRGFVAAGHPSLSFDARRFLFVGRKSKERPDAVFEMNADGTGLRQVIAPAYGCDRPAYLSTLFTLDAEGPIEQIGFRARVSKAGPTAIVRCRSDGTEVAQITYAPDGVASPLLITDGRLLFSMSLKGAGTTTEPNADVTIGLVSVYTDGTDIFPFNDAAPGTIRRAMCETNDGTIVYAESNGRSDQRDEALLCTARTRPWIMHRLSEIPPGTKVASVSAVSTGQLLVASRPSNPRSRSTFGIELLDRATGRSAGVVYDSDAWHEVSAFAIEPQRVPAGRSTVVGSATTVGQLYCLDAYEGREERAGSNEGATIAGVRVYARVDDEAAAHIDAADAGPAAESTSESYHRARRHRSREVVLGEAMLETDGSFFIELPAARPIRLETLDESGRPLRAMGTWFWVMPMERRGCIGCHEDRRLTPPNRHVLALRKPPQRMDSTAGELREIEERDDQDEP